MGLIRLQCLYRSSGLPNDDVRVTTHDFFVNRESWPGGAAGEDYLSVMSDFDQYFTIVKKYWPNTFGLDEYRFYREDDNQPPWGIPSYVRSNIRIAGSNSKPGLPPQCAMSVTEKTHTRRRWGRFYLPGFAASSGADTNPVLGGDGRFNNACITEIATATQALYDAVSARGLQSIVLGTVGATGGFTMPEVTNAHAWLVRSIQIDDVVDVIRSRRHKQPMSRHQRDINPRDMELPG